MWKLPTLFREEGDTLCYGNSVRWDSGAFWAEHQLNCTLEGQRSNSQRSNKFLSPDCILDPMSRITKSKLQGGRNLFLCDLVCIQFQNYVYKGSFWTFKIYLSVCLCPWKQLWGLWVYVNHPSTSPNRPRSVLILGDSSHWATQMPT